MKKDRDYPKSFADRRNDKLIDFRRKNVYLNQVEHYRYDTVKDLIIPAIVSVVCFGIAVILWCNIDLLKAVFE